MQGGETFQAILPIQTQGDKPPLFLIHPGSGTAFSYLPLSYHFPEQPIYGLINPRFYEESNQFTSIEEMASHYCEIIKNVKNVEVYRLGGWSFGGLVAYEIAHRLQMEHKKVEIVIMIDTYNISQLNYTITTEEEHNANLLELGIEQTSLEANYFKKELINNEQLAIHYQPKMYQGKVVLLKAKETPFGTMKTEEVMDRGWKKYFHPNFKIIETPGTHYQLFSNKYIKDLSANIYPHLLL